MFNVRIAPSLVTRSDNLFPYKPEEKFYTTAEGIPIVTVYAFNLSHYTKKKDLFSLCAEMFGPVKKVKIIKKFPKAPGPLNGFITFFKPEDAAKCIRASSEVKLRHRTVCFAPADSWHHPEVSRPEPTDEESDDDEESKSVVGVRQISSAGSISMLNDDCLRLIFDLFLIEERLVLGKVCKRWRVLNDLYWTSLTELEFGVAMRRHSHFNIKVINEILSHCPNLTRLRIREDSLPTTSSSLLVPIGTHCKKLEELIWEYPKLHKRCLLFLADSCPDLRLLHFHSVANLKDFELSFFLKKCEKLESLKVEVKKSKTNQWFRHLKPPLKELHVLTDHCDDLNFYMGLGRIRKTLKCLSIDLCRSFSIVQLQYIVDNLVDLEMLSLKASLSLRCSGLAKMEIVKLKKLKSLDISFNNTVEHQFINELAANCVDLETLELAGIANMECNGRSLTQLIGLKRLNLARSPYLTDDVLASISRNLTKLESICLSFCINVTDDGIIELIQNCPKLKTIDLHYCTQVTCRTIFAALDVLLCQRERRKIKMFVRDSNIYQDEFDHIEGFDNYFDLDFSPVSEILAMNYGLAIPFEEPIDPFDLLDDEIFED